jgi:hypothetical protein
MPQDGQMQASHGLLPTCRKMAIKVSLRENLGKYYTILQSQECVLEKKGL